MAKRRGGGQAGPAKAREDAPASRAEQIDRRQRLEVLQAAVAKRNRGEKLAPKEIAAIRRYELEEQQRHGAVFVRAVPKKLYGEWSGRQTKVLHDQARLYGAPLEGATIDVPALVRWLHDFLAEHKHELAIVAKGETGAMAAGGRGELVAEQVEQLRKKNRLLDAKLEEQARSLVPREKVHEYLLLMANMLRGAGHRLYKQCGDKAGDILQQTIADFEARVTQLGDGRIDRHAAADDGGDAPDAA